MEPIFFSQRPPKQKVNDFLIKYSKNETSQSGEDGIIEQIFTLIDEFDADNNVKSNHQRWCAECELKHPF